MRLGGPSPDPGNAFNQTAQVAVEYLRFKYVDKFVKFHAHVQGLPREEAVLTWTALVLAGIVVIATPALAGFAARFAPISFLDVQDQAQSLPAPAFALALLAFSLGWGYLLSGAAQGPGLIWILAGLLYEYLLLIVGLAAGRSYLHIVVFLLPVVVGALTPAGPPAGKIVLAVLVASFAVRLLPLSAAVRAHWYLLWPAAAGVLLGVHLLLARRPWPSALVRTALASATTLAYIVLIAAAVRQAGLLAGWLHVALNTAIGLLELLWFLLGASFVGGAIALAIFARGAIERVVPVRVLHLVILVGWSALAVWAVRAVPKGAQGPYQLYAAGILLAFLVTLGTWWRIKGMSREWLAGWFVAAVAAMLSLRTYTTLDLGSLLTRNADVLTLAGFAYAITWEVASHIRSIPLSMRGFAQPAPLLLYLGIVLLICGASLFGLAANLKFFQEEVILSEYRGALSLGLPLGLLTAAATWPVLPHRALRRCVAGFLLAAVLAVPAFLLRAAAGPWITPVLILGLATFSAILARLWPEIDGHLPAAALGCATALGFAISVSQRVLVDVLPPLMTMVASLEGVPGLRAAAKVVERWSQDAAWNRGDQVGFFVAGPLLAVVATVLVTPFHRRANANADPAPSQAQAP